MLIAIVATGPSMTLEVAADLDCTPCIAINNACVDTVIDGVTYPARVPSPLAVAANDVNWWRQHPTAHSLTCRKFSANKIPGVEQVFSDYVTRQSSSGVLALEVARLHGAREIHLYGFDNAGTHYFGQHPAPLTQTPPGRFAIFEQQLAALGGEMAKAGIRIVNRSPASALRCFARG